MFCSFFSGQLHHTVSLPRHVKPNVSPFHQPRLPQHNVNTGYQNSYGTASQRRNTAPVKEMRGRIENVDYGDEMKRQNILFTRSKTLDKDFRAHRPLQQRFCFFIYLLLQYLIACNAFLVHFYNYRAHNKLSLDQIPESYL